MSRRAIDIAFLYEKAVRELDVACIIKEMLRADYDLHVEIFQQNYQPEVTVTRFKPRVVVLPFCYQERSNSVFLLGWRDATFFNLTWEQLLYAGNAVAKTPRGEFALKHCIHHAWGETYANLLRQIGVPEQHIYVNGNPAYMLYREPYRRYYRDRASLALEHGLDPNKRWIFFPENYNWAFYDQATLDRFIKDGQGSADVHDLHTFSRRSFVEVMKWLQSVLQENNVEIILRPRPATSPTEFVEAAKNVLGSLPAGLFITQADTVREWILASDIVVSSYSTSIIEASLAGVPVYLLEPFPLPDLLVTEWQKYIPHLRSAGEFAAVVAVSGLHETGSNLKEWASSQLLAHGDPIRNIAEKLAQICSGKAPIPSAPRPEIVTYAGRYRLPWWLVRAYRQLRLHYFASFPNRDVYFEYENDVLALDTVPEKMKRWANVIRKAPV